jgi:RES domain-containing protein
MQEVIREQLPRGWRRFPAPASLQKLGDAWLEAGETAVLAVPSAVIPMEKNYLLNPSHPEMKGIQIGTPQPFRLDFRAGR